MTIEAHDDKGWITLQAAGKITGAPVWLIEEDAVRWKLTHRWKPGGRLEVRVHEVLSRYGSAGGKGVSHGRGSSAFSQVRPISGLRSTIRLPRAR